MMLFVLIFSLYGWVNNLVAYTTYKSVQTGPLRPIFTFVQIFLEGLFVFHLLKNGDTRIHYPVVSIFFVFLFILFFAGAFDVDRGLTKNETGLFANLCLVTMVLIRKHSSKISPLLIPFGALLAMPSTITVFGFLPFYQRKRLIFFSVFSVLIITSMLVRPDFIQTVFTSKISLIIDPPMSDQFGGRYWSNLFHILMLLEKPFFGWGLESLNHYREVNYNVPSFDHGGSDILMILANFGVLGSLILLVLFFLVIRSQFRDKLELDYIGVLVSLLLLFKGVGFFTTSGSLSLIILMCFSSKVDKLFYNANKYR